MNLAIERIALTGGAGFLGRHLQQELRDRGVPPENLLIPHVEDYDLTNETAVVRMYDDMKPSIVIHLAASLTWRWGCI
jgi:GDP-L-fucose synthase